MSFIYRCLVVLGVFLTCGMNSFYIPVSYAAESTVKGFKVDSKQPIEINSDTLSVDNNQQSAVFNGNVQVAQGGLRLKTNRLTVLYKSAAERKGQTSSAGAGSTESIRSLVAEGNVFVSSEDSTAKGNKAVYDVSSRHLSVTGGVVLTQGPNVLQGEILNVNLTTGISTISGGGGSGRVRTLFKPADSKK
jgi:lipopolysaccharide export system protein LptA